MSELIERQEAIDRFNVIRPADPKKDEYTKGIDVGIAMGIVAVKDQPTIQPEKAQLSKEGTTSDLISRTETVEHLRRVLDVTVPITDYDSGYVDGVEFGVSTVSTMPTIQPQSTTGQLNDGVRSTARSTDLIDRQAAIDAAESAYVRNMFPTPLIREVPTVQPERKRGEWLPDNNNAYEMRFVCSCCKESEIVPTIGFTKYRPLWDFCPNCGAKMEGANHETD